MTIFACMGVPFLVPFPPQKHCLFLSVAALNSQYFEGEYSSDDEYQPTADDWKKVSNILIFLCCTFVGFTQLIILSWVFWLVAHMLWLKVVI